MDIYYGLRPDEGSPQPVAHELAGEVIRGASISQETEGAPPIVVGPEVWKTFVSPFSSFKLFANPETSGLQVMAPGNPPLPPPWVQIPPCPQETHRQIAQTFINMLPEETQRVALSKAMAQPSFWWTAYYSVIVRLGLAPAWNAYRRRRLLDELEVVLKNHGVSLPRAEPEAQAAERSLRPVAQPPGVPLPAGESLIRSLAVEVVRNMPVAELRTLHVPLGYVVDALARRRG
jgi:hypothetical protein